MSIWLPIGNNSKQVQYLKEKTSKWADNIKAGHLTPTEAYLAAITTIWKTKTIEYPLTTLNLSREELKTITWPVYKAAFKKMGVHQCIAATVRDGPRRLLGLGFTNPFHTQGVRRLRTLLEQLWHDTPSGYLLRTNVEALIMELGIFGSFFDQDKVEALTWANTSHAWLLATLRYGHTEKITLSLPFAWMEPIRTADESIMLSF